MIWIKRRDGAGEWIVGHYGVNGGTNPWEYEMLLHADNDQGDSANKFNDTAPSNSHFTVGDSVWVNGNNNTYIAMLFASVDGISKLGYYDGTSHPTNVTLNLGFQPRFILIKRTDSDDEWMIFDSTRGINSTNNNERLIHFTNAAQTAAYPGYDYIDISSSNPHLTIKANTHSGQNNSSGKYIYYAHA